uniref:Uncharacterized protein n=1 Tax=Romanomermis culicivorax TaxID=13658 RepID=A0A915KB60_ROMCU
METNCKQMKNRKKRTQNVEKEKKKERKDKYSCTDIQPKDRPMIFSTIGEQPDDAPSKYI